MDKDLIATDQWFLSILQLFLGHIVKKKEMESVVISTTGIS